MTGTGEASIFVMISRIAESSPPGVFRTMISRLALSLAALSIERVMYSEEMGCTGASKEIQMIKNDIALAIEKKTEFNRAKSLLIVESILKSLKGALEKNQKVEIRGFGSFRVVDKKTGYGRDIRRKKQIKIEKGKRIKFRSGQELKSALVRK